MIVRWTFVAFLLALTPVAHAAEPDFSSPKATFQTFLEGMRKNDLELTARCWVIDDDNRSGALDLLVGRWIASRKLSAITNAKLGSNGMRVLGRWHRLDLSDAAIEKTLARLEQAEITERDDLAKLKFKWQPGDNQENKVFLYLNVPFGLRKMGKDWKIDANAFLETDRAEDLFKTGSIWLIWREEMELMNQLAEMLEKRKIQTVPQFEKQVKESVEALKVKYAAREKK